MNHKILKYEGSYNKFYIYWNNNSPHCEGWTIRKGTKGKNNVYVSM